MAKIKVNGAAAVVRSDVRLEDYKKIEKYRPQKLVLVDENQEPVFSVKTAQGMGSIGKYGAVFGEVTDGAEKYATITLVEENGFGEDAKHAITEKVGAAILNLNKIEARVPEIIREINAELAEIESNIEV